MMALSSGNRGLIISKIRSSLTEPGHVTSDVTGMERISSGGSLSQLDSSSSSGSGSARAQRSSNSSNSSNSNSNSQEVEFYSVNGLAINRMVEHAPTLSSYSGSSAALSAIRHGINSRHKRGGGAAGSRTQNLFSVCESGDSSADSSTATAAASGSTSSSSSAYQDAQRGRWGGVSLDDSASPVTAVKTVTHWGSPAEHQQQQQLQPFEKHSFAQNSFAHHQSGEPLLGPSTTVLRHLYFQQGRRNAQNSNSNSNSNNSSNSSSSGVKKRAGAAAPMMIANGMNSINSSMHAAAAEPDALLVEFQRQRARSGSVGLG
jgi:hypothetical protein